MKEKILVVAIVGVMIFTTISSQGQNLKIAEKIPKTCLQPNNSLQISLVKIDKLIIGFGTVYAKSTGQPSWTNFIQHFPSDKTSPPYGIYWHFDGTGIDAPRTILKGFVLTLKPIEEIGISSYEEVIGPQTGVGYLLFGTYYRDLLEIRGVGVFAVWNYTEIPPNITNVHPAPGSKDVSIKANFTWDLTFPYIGEEKYVEYTVKIILPGGEVKEFHVKGKRYLDLKEEDFTLRYNTSYSWEVTGKTETGERIEPVEELQPYPWNFTTQKDPNPPYKPKCVSPPNGGTNVACTNTLIAWDGGDPDEYDQVKYHVYMNISENVDENSPIQKTTDYYPWDQKFVYVRLEEDLQPNTTYYWKVIAEDWGKNRNESEIFMFTTGGD